MSFISKKQDYFDTPEGLEVKEILKSMSTDENYTTRASYSPNTEQYSDNLIPFIDKHMSYLRRHPQVNPTQYISNLRLLTRKK